MAGSLEILTAIRELTNTKQLDRTELHGLLFDGITAALAKKHGPTVQAEVDIDEDKGTIRIVRLRTVVADVNDAAREISLDEARFTDEEFQVGDVMEDPVDFSEFGRMAVLAAKQRIIQRVREGERTKIRDEFTSRVGDLLSGEVQQIERGKLVIMLNKFREAEAVIPYREQNHREHFHQGDPLRAVLKRVEETPKGPRLMLSRGDPMFVKALFKLEVPEIQQGIVEIRAAAREVGNRTKIAVFSRDDSVDPVGACVGLKGSRVQAVVNELGGERIDIVPWSADPERFAKLALAPARVARVFSDAASKTIQAVVDEDQLSLAIGRNGQNVRLASELTEWKIELYSSREWMERGTEQQLFAPLPGETDDAVNPRLSEIEGLEPATIAVLEEAGYRTLDDVIDLEREDFLRLAGIAPEEADRLMTIINELTTDDDADADADSDGGTPSDTPAMEVPEAPGDEGDGPDPGGTLGSDGGAGYGTNANDGEPNEHSDAGSVPKKRARYTKRRMTDQIAKRKALGLIGLGLRGRLAVVGVQQVRDAAKHGKLKVALVANDASKNSLDKVVGLLKAREVPVIDKLSAMELGTVSGREAVAVIGVTNTGLARGIRDAFSGSAAEEVRGQNEPRTVRD